MRVPRGSVLAESVLMMVVVGAGLLWLLRSPILDLAKRFFVSLFFMEGYSEW
jgi:hypothetical protein